jgi:hypothetical protein
VSLLSILFALLFPLVPAPGSETALPRVRWEREQRLTDDPAPSLLTYNFARSIAADGSGRVHAVWYDARGGSSRIYYKRSADSGRSWDPDTRLSETAGPDEHPAIAISGPTVYVVWHGIRDGKFDIFLRRSADGGLTWEPAAALTDGHKAAHASIAASGSAVHVVWGDNRTGNAEIHTRHSTDFGVTWDAEKRLTDLPYESWVPTVAVSGRHVFVAWVDYRDGNEEEYIKRSTDGGVTWGPDTRLTSDPADSWAPSLAISGPAVYLVWFDRRDSGVTDFDVEKKLDDIMRLLGLHVEPAPGRDPSVYYLPPFMQRIDEKRKRIQDAAPAWVRGGGDPQRLETELREFEERMRTWSFGWEIYFKRSLDGGESWSPDIRLTHAPDVSARPSIAAAESGLYVVWFDGRDGNFEVYGKHSSDGGNTWSSDLRLSEASGESAHPTVAVSGSSVHVLWHDTRHGNAEIYYRRGYLGRSPPRAVPFRQGG